MALAGNSNAVTNPEPVIHQTTHKAPAPTHTPLNQLSPAQFAAQQTAKSQATADQYANYLATNMGRVNYNVAAKNANTLLGQEVSPLLSGLNSQQTAGQQAINSFTQQFATQLGSIGTNINSAYNQAEQQQSALDTSIAASLRGAGTDQANALQATLQAAGQNTAPAAEAAQAASGAAGAAYASGSASLSQLIGQGAASAAYGAQLPGYAALSGLQATKQLQASIANQRSQILANAQQEFPTLLNDQVNQQLTNEKNIAAGLKGQADVAATNAKNAQNYVINQGKNTIAAAKVKATAGAAELKALQPKYFSAGGSEFASVPDGKGGFQTVQLTQPAGKPLQLKSIAGGGLVQFDPNTGRSTVIRQPTSKPPVVHTRVVKTANGQILINSDTGAKIAKFTNPPSASTPKGARTTNEALTKVDSIIRTATHPAAPHYYQGQPIAGSGGSITSYGDVKKQILASLADKPQLQAQALAKLNADPNYQPGDNGRAYDNIQEALPNIEQNVAASIANKSTANAVYKAFLATGVYPPKLRKQLAYAINRLYTQDYFKQNPTAQSLPANVLINS